MSFCEELIVWSRHVLVMLFKHLQIIFRVLFLYVQYQIFVCLISNADFSIVIIYDLKYAQSKQPINIIY